MERISRFRAVSLLLIFCGILLLYAVKLFDLQIIEADGKDNATVYSTITTVRAARGDILDRNGKVLVGNRASYDLVFNHYVTKSADNRNDHLLRLCKKCDELGIEYLDHFPITKQRPFEYTLQEYSSAWQRHFQSFMTDWSLDPDVSAPLLMEKLRARYKIPDEWTDEEARSVVGIRYEFDLRGITNLPNYIFIEDVSDEDLSALLELNIPGLMVEPTTVREYHTKYAAQILGYTGAINPDEWEYYKNIDGYAMNNEIGKDGMEGAFEEQLHGVDGWRLDTVDKEGNLIARSFDVEPKAGNNVETTIDMAIQIATEDSLERTMKELTAQDQNADGHDAEGAAAVMMDVRTGEILACASYPTYDPARIYTDYNGLLEEDLQPLYNRALLAPYPPGSTFKMAMAIAGIDHGYIGQYTEIYDAGVFTKYDDFAPTCLVYSNYGVTHGLINVMQALEVSCNYFFYALSDMMKIDEIDETVKQLGLGEPTGVELVEDTGHRSNPETKKENYEGSDAYWYPADTLTTSIGQGLNRFTPMQLCSYTAALANRGLRYKATFLKRVVSPDYTELLQENAPVVLSTMNISDEAYAAYTTGMQMVAQQPDGTAYSIFGNYTIPVAAKTGTAQRGENISDNGALVCYAPADAPEVAVVVYGEKAGHGTSMGQVARDMLDAYFATDPAHEFVTVENRVG